MKLKHITDNSFQTKKLGESFAKKILRTQLKNKAQVLELIGDLGSGKTTFLQGFAKGLGIKDKILSPTFVIMKKFKISRNSHNSHKSRNSFKASKAPTAPTAFYHIDCYRIKKPKEFLDLGFKEIISNPKNIIAIEWSDQIKKILPKNTLIIKFDFIDENKRKIEIDSC